MYKRRTSLKLLFDISLRLVDTLIAEIEECKRYPKNAVIRNPGYVLVDVDVFQDYLEHRQQIKDGTTSKKLPPYKRDNLRYLNAVD